MKPPGSGTLLAPADRGEGLALRMLFAGATTQLTALNRFILKSRGPGSSMRFALAFSDEVKNE